MRLDAATLTEAARGKWSGILAGYGVDRKFLTRRNGPCPFCGGKDRYRFTDMNGDGMWFCNSCGAGNGFQFLMHLKGWDFPAALKQVAEIVGAVECSPPTPQFDQRVECRAIWARSVPVAMDTPAARYLHRRLGLIIFPAALRYVECLRYEEEGQPASWHPAMIALVRDPAGAPVSLHRTYLTREGAKAAVRAPKKLMRGRLPKGSAIRLGGLAEGTLGVAEGTETALAASRRFGVPVWSAISADGMAQWVCPAEVRRLVICGDRDASYTGQWAAYACARGNRIKRPDLIIDVEFPPAPGDFADFVTTQPE